jgi:hypothetical protein
MLSFYKHLKKGVGFWLVNLKVYEGIIFIQNNNRENVKATQRTSCCLFLFARNKTRYTTSGQVDPMFNFYGGF